MNCRYSYKICFFILLPIALALLFPKTVFATNILSNSGFEDEIKDWSFTPSTATFSATASFKHDGNYGAILTKETASSWAYFNQKVPIEADKYYRMSGWVLLNDGIINNMKLRFYWLDASEAKISTDPVEVVLSDKNSSFKFLQTEISVAPSNAQFADVQGYVNLDQKNPPNPAVFDDLIFEDVPPPILTPAPTSIPEPTATPQPADTPTSPPPTLTSTPTVKPSLTPTKTPTPSISLTATPSGEVLGEGIASGSGLSQLSDEENKATASSEESGNIKKIILPALAAILGLGFIGFSIFSFLKGRRQKEEPEEVVV